MNGETLTVLLEWTIHGSPTNDTLGLPMTQSKTWLVDRSFWQSWEQNNKPLPVPWDSKEWGCIDQEPVWGMAINHKGMSKILDICFSKVENNISPNGSDRQCRRTLLDQFSPKTDPVDIRLMTDNYIIGGEGYYMPSESFRYLRKCARPGSSTLGQVERFSWTDPLVLDPLVPRRSEDSLVLDPLDPRRSGDPLLPVPLDPLVPT